MLSPIRNGGSRIGMIRLFATVVLAAGFLLNDCVSQETGVAIHLSDSGFENQRTETDPISGARRPLLIILPGILGERIWDRNVRLGIKKSRFSGESLIYDWTRGPLMMASNMGGNLEQNQALVEKIVKFKNLNPDRPLYLLGHSGGCRMVVEILEQMPSPNLVERAVLLSPCLKANYDLSIALSQSRFGIVSFHSPLDIPISVPLTAIHGLAKGSIDVSATATGFKVPEKISERGMQQYRNKLVQKKFESRMIATGNMGGHFGWTTQRFVSEYVAPCLNNSFVTEN